MRAERKLTGMHRSLRSSYRGVGTDRRLRSDTRPTLCPPFYLAKGFENFGTAGASNLGTSGFENFGAENFGPDRSGLVSRMMALRSAIFSQNSTRGLSSFPC